MPDLRLVEEDWDVEPAGGVERRVGDQEVQQLVPGRGQLLVAGAGGGRGEAHRAAGCGRAQRRARPALEAVVEAGGDAGHLGVGRGEGGPPPRRQRHLGQARAARSVARGGETRPWNTGD